MHIIEKVLADYYAVDLVFGGDTYACMMHHDMFRYMERTMQSVLGQYLLWGTLVHSKESTIFHVGNCGFKLCANVPRSRYEKYSGMFIHYDEIRTMHGCELCSGPFDTAGELLAVSSV